MHAIHRHLDLIQIAPIFSKNSMQMLRISFPHAQIVLERSESCNRNTIHSAIDRKRTRQTAPHALSTQCTARAPDQNLHTASDEHEIDTECCPRREFHRHCSPVLAADPELKGKVNGLQFSAFLAILKVYLSKRRSVCTASASLLVAPCILAPERTILMAMQFKLHAPSVMSGDRGIDARRHAQN